MSEFSKEKWLAIVDASAWFRQFCRDNDVAEIRALSKIGAVCICPSGQSGHSHASWCLHESSRDQASQSLEEMFPLTFEEIERNRACLSKAWLIQAELVEALEEIAASGARGDQQIASAALARMTDRISREVPALRASRLASEDGAAVGAAGAWVPWKEGDQMPPPGLYLCAMKSKRTVCVEERYLEAMPGFTRWNTSIWQVVAYWSSPKPPPFNFAAATPPSPPEGGRT